MCQSKINKIFLVYGFVSLRLEYAICLLAVVMSLVGRTHFCNVVIHLWLPFQSNVSGRRTLFEVGCGVGNFIFPLIAEDKEKHFFFHACDFSSKAVELVKVQTSFIAVILLSAELFYFSLYQYYYTVI